MSTRRQSIPLIMSEEPLLSTRGQALPSLLSERGRQFPSFWSERVRQLPSRRSERRNDRSDTSQHEDRMRSEEAAMALLNTPQVRSMRLIGNSNPRFRWAQYWKTQEELKKMKSSLRDYYERINLLVPQYLYIDKLLDSSLPHDLIREYSDHDQSPTIPKTFDFGDNESATASIQPPRFSRSRRRFFRVPQENTPLLDPLLDDEDEDVPIPNILAPSIASVTDVTESVVNIVIYLYLVATLLSVGGNATAFVLTNSLAVLAGLVNAALELLNTMLVWYTTHIIAHHDQYNYPVGRGRLEPIGFLIFSVIMITSFSLVALECLFRLASSDGSVLQLGLIGPIAIASTTLIKLFVWLGCRLSRSSSIQALVRGGGSGIVFGFMTILFPFAGSYTQAFWMDGAGGLLLSLYVMISWVFTVSKHVENLTGRAASPLKHSLLLYLVMRFAKTIRAIDGLNVYHTGEKVNVEVNIMLDYDMTVRDSHDLSESLQFVIETVPWVERAYVHQVYSSRTRFTATSNRFV